MFKSEYLFNHVILLYLKRQRKDQRQGKIKVNTDWSLHQQLFILLPLLFHDFCQNKWRWRRHDFRQNLSPASSVLSSGSGLWFITYDRHFTSLTTDLCQEVYQSWPIGRNQDKTKTNTDIHENHEQERKREIDRERERCQEALLLFSSSFTQIFDKKLMIPVVFTDFLFLICFFPFEREQVVIKRRQFSSRDCSTGFLERLPWESLYDSQILIVTLIVK